MRIALLALALAAPALAHAETPVPHAAREKAAIRDVVTTMEAAWNRSDFRGYMDAFQNPGVIFVSKGKIQADWQATLDHYVRDYGTKPGTRGDLHFHDITVEMLAPDAAQLISHYDLVRPAHSQHGINTRLMRKVHGRWVIALNHVSAVED